MNMTTRKRVSTATLRKMKEDGDKIAMVTAYDYPSAKLAEEAGSDMILVGDTLGMVVLGYDSTIPVTIEDMIHHSKAVTRGAPNTFVVTDMPFATYHGSLDKTIERASTIMREASVHALKLEGGSEIAKQVAALVNTGIPVVGHIGLTPQSVLQIGGWKIQGRNKEQAEKLLSDALALEAAGAFAIVLEMVPEELATYVTSKLSVPTIGIGSGRHCDGQVLVYHDLLSYASPLKPRFVKQYANIGDTVRQAIGQYVNEVKAGQFPEEANVFHAEESVLDMIKDNADRSGGATLESHPQD